MWQILYIIHFDIQLNNEYEMKHEQFNFVLIYCL
jgi:hypothetical protein